MEACLNQEVLVEFLFDRLEPANEGTVVEHVGSCERCRAELETLSDDPLLRTLRDGCSSGPEADERAAAAALLVEEFLWHPPHEELAPAGAPGVGPRLGPALLPDRTLPCELGRYRLLSVLGSGGMGVVYRALHTGLGREMAIKLLPPGRRQDAGFAARFRREMQSIGRLQHPHIVLAHDAGEIDGTLYLAMEFVEGCDLETLARSQGRLSAADACEAVRQAALGLAHAHGHGLVHRDVKPSNLLVSRDGTVKVADLGLARLAASAGAETLSGTGGVVGTLDYMAPEQAERSQGADARSDLYSLGCVLFRLLAGRPPFRGDGLDTPLSTLFRQVHEPPPPIDRFRDDLPPGLALLVGRLLAKDPRERPQSALELSELLEPFRSGADLAARVAECGERTTVGESAGALAAHLQQTAVLDGSTAGETAGPTVVAAASAGGRRLRRSRRPGIGAGILLLLLAATIAAIVLTGRSPDAEPRSEADSPSVLSAAGLEGAAPQPDAIHAAVAESRDFEDLAPDEVARGVWYPLLNREPEEILWRNGELSSYRLDPDERRLQVSCEKVGLLAFGRVESDDYTLRVDIHQNRWMGGVGIFFGCREETLEGQRCWRYQTISLAPNVGLQAKEFPFQLIRSREILRLDRDDGANTERGIDATALMPAPNLEPQELEIVVRRGRLLRVRWAGREMPQLVALPNGRPIPDDRCQGGFGSLHVRSDSNLSDLQLRIEHSTTVGRQPPRRRAADRRSDD